MIVGLCDVFAATEPLSCCQPKLKEDEPLHGPRCIRVGDELSAVPIPPFFIKSELVGYRAEVFASLKCFGSAPDFWESPLLQVSRSSCVSHPSVGVSLASQRRTPARLRPNRRRGRRRAGKSFGTPRHASTKSPYPAASETRLIAACLD